MSVRNMDYEELRPMVLEILKGSEETQIINVLNAVEQYALGKGFYRDAPEWSYGGQVTTHKMPREDREKVREIISDLVFEGILCWGMNEHDPAPPFLKVTRHGKDILQHGEPQPYDPDGYIRYLKTEIPTVDETILAYLEESLNAYLRGLNLSSTVMLGGASEKAFLLLFEAYTNALADTNKKMKFQKKANIQIKQKIDALRPEIDELKRNKILPRELSDDLEIQLDGVCNFIRGCRNDVGHPTGRKIDRALAFANLRLFVPYCKRVYALIQFFENNQI